MCRKACTPRPGWISKVKADGLSFYNLEGLKWLPNQSTEADYYWNEEGCVQITHEAEK